MGIFHQLSHHRPRERGRSLEDFFTELWAHVLRRRPELLEAFLQKIGATLGSGKKTVETQVVYEKTAVDGCVEECRPDLKISDESGRYVLLEHKIGADQREEWVRDAKTGTERLVSQLERYLWVSPDHQLAYITHRSSEVADSVQQHARYLKPERRPHFTWADFHELVKTSASATGDPFVEELLQFMEDLDMRPALEGTGLLPSANDVDQSERRAWERRWDRTIAYLATQGWQLTYRGLEVFFRRADTVGPDPLQLDLRYKERKGYEGRLKARVRVAEKPAGPPLLPALLEGSVVRVRRSNGDVAWDIQLTTKQTRAEWIGTADPEARLLDFAKLILPLVTELMKTSTRT